MASQIVNEVKRGQVYYMDVPSKDQPLPLPNESCVQKKRPYIVLSTDEMNATSELIHVAPITTKPPYDHQWYRVPFKSRDQTYRWINMSYIMLVPKRYCTVADYSESISQMTFGNKELMSRIDECILRWFSVTPKSVENTPEPVNEEVVTTNSNIPNINITINIPGLTPIQTTVSANAESNIEVGDTTAEDTTDTDVEDRPKNKLTRVTWFSPEKQMDIYDYLKTHARTFGGDKTDKEICEELHISLATIGRYKARLRKCYNTESTSINNNTPKRRKVTTRPKKYFKNKAEEAIFMTYYEHNGPKAAYKRFKDSAGFKNIRACYSAYWLRKHNKVKA